MEIQIKAIVTEPPPAPISISWWPWLTASIATKTAMIVVGVSRFISAHLAVGADPRIRVPVSNLRSPVPVPSALSSIPKSGPRGEYSSNCGRTLLVFRRLTALLFGCQWHSSPPPLTISASLKSTTSQRMRRLINECFGSLGSLIDVDVTTPRSDEISAACHYEGGINILGVTS